MIETEIIIKLIISAFLGIVIGLEREIRHKPAGLRTHAFVCMGACLFTIVSLSVQGADPSRIAASVVTGIGFIGAGMIWQSRDKIIGLTTATELWVLAAVGLTVGIGYYTIGIITTTLVLLILILGRTFEKKALKKR